jgi:AraC-like DNA-binding protein
VFEPSISAGFVRALVDLAAARGADREALCWRSGIAADDFADQDRRLPLACYAELMREAKAMTGDPALALHFGEAFDITELSIVGLMGQASDNYADAFEHLGRYVRLAIDVELEEEAGGQRMVIRRDEAGTWLVDMRKNPNDFPELTESSFARMAASSGRANMAPNFLKAVHFTHKAPAYRDEYERIFRVPLVFESRWNAVLVADDSWMTMKPPAHSAYVLAILRERADALLEALDGAASTRFKVEKLLEPLLHTGGARMADAARRLGVSRATLFRRLRAEGTSFERVLDEVRRRLAFAYIVDKKLRVNEAAYLLGFSDPAAFSRAFKRWTGRSPREMRGR